MDKAIWNQYFPSVKSTRYKPSQPKKEACERRRKIEDLQDARKEKAAKFLDW